EETVRLVRSPLQQRTHHAQRWLGEFVEVGPSVQRAGGSVVGLYQVPQCERGYIESLGQRITLVHQHPRDTGKFVDIRLERVVVLRNEITYRPQRHPELIHRRGQVLTFVGEETTDIRQFVVEGTDRLITVGECAGEIGQTVHRVEQVALVLRQRLRCLPQLADRVVQHLAVAVEVPRQRIHQVGQFTGRVTAVRPQRGGQLVETV